MEHSDIQEQIPLYALGGLPMEESTRMGQHLEICPSCRALLSEYQFVADELLVQVPAQTAPANIGIRLANLTTPNGKRWAAASGRQDIPFWKQALVLPRWGLALVLLALLLLLGATGVLAWQLVRNERSPDQVAQMLAAPDLKILPLNNGTSGSNSGAGYICLVGDKNTALLWLYGLDPLDKEHAYQVWLRDDATRVSGGVFRADWDGRAVSVIQAPRPLSEYKEIGITVEPAAGSPEPTTPRIAGGNLY